MKIPSLVTAVLAAASGAAAAYDSVVVFNELNYHPDATRQEFVELRNLNGVDINLSGWKVTGGIDYTFPENSFIPGHGYLVLGGVPGAAAAFTGSLDNGGETIRLRNRNGRIMDELNYGDSGPWPPGADGSGFTLARREADASDNPAAWTVSRQPGGTPGEINFLQGTAVDRVLVSSRDTWRYSDSDAAPPAGWAAPAFDDSAWSEAPAAFGSGAGSDPALTVTATLTERFRAGDLTGLADGATVTIWPDTAADDGATQHASAGGTDPILKTGATPSGKPVVRFDGTDELRTTVPPGISGADGFCYWIVLKTSAAPDDGLLSNGAGDYFFDRHLTGSGIPLVSLKAVSGYFGVQKRFDGNTGLGGPISTTPISLDGFQMVTIRRNRISGLFELWINGMMESSEPDTGAALTPDPINIGNYGTSTTKGFTGDIAELLIYRDGLTDSDFQSVGSYLESEYGLETAFAGTSIATSVSATAPSTYYRKSFQYAGDPSRSELRLETTASDGAVFYLNGTELRRQNLPAGPVSHSTPALAAVSPPASTGFVTVPAGALQAGGNVLSVSLHKAAGSTASFFNATLEATELPEDPVGTQRLAFHEITGAADPAFFVELRNSSSVAVSTGGWQLRTGNGQTFTLPAGTLAPGALLALNAATLGFTPADGDRLFLLAPGGGRLTDARVLTNRLRGLTPDGAWGYPAAATPGSANPFSIPTDIVLNEIFYHSPIEGPEQWIELYNKGASTVDLSGWKLDDGVSWQCPAGTSLPAGGYLVIAWDPAGFAALHPGRSALGPWSGSLSGSGERIALLDATGNTADEVTYADGGRWSEWADGGGSSLELIDPRADNRNPGAWESSDESLAAPWQTFSYTGTGAHATTSSLTYYNEMVLGLLDAGEVLIDNISVKEVNAGNRELIQNGDFETGTAAAWRNIGTHRTSEVVDDPLSPGNKVLRISASGSMEHMNNHCETTLKADAAYVRINTSSTYTVSFRAKWLRGTNRLRTSLYFNRLPRQFQLERPATGGTPGAVNSRRVPNAGPALSPASVSPVVPAAGGSATVTLSVADPDGLSAVELLTSLNGAAFISTPMALSSGGEYTATVPGQPAGSQVQFYIRATDTAAAVSTWPKAGPDSRAMIPWQDGRSIPVMPSGARPHNLRVVMPATDANFLYLPENVQSNEYRPCTVILDDERAWYEAATRLKSSEHGRFQQNRVGYNLKFGSDALFLGAHDTVSVDRSGNRSTEGLDGSTVTSQREILIKAMMNAAGGIYSVEDDLIRMIAPVASTSPPPAFTGVTVTGEAILSKSRFDDEYLDGQFDNGGDGPLFKQEYIYPLTQTINPVTRAVTTIASTGNLNASAEQPKIAQTGGSPGPSGISVRAYPPPSGTDPRENYRWHWLIRNARTNDDYTGLIAAITAVGQAPNSSAFNSQTAASLDVDTWLRAVIPAQLFGVTDNYTANSGSTHNFLLYFPPGGKGTAIPWDLDFLGQSSPSAGITAGGDITKFIANQANKRRYYGHVLDILNRSFNDAFLTRWATHYSRFGVDDMTSSLPFLRSRATYVRNLVTGQGGQNAPVPVTAFTLTSPASVSVTTPFATVTGDGWIDIDFIRLAGSPAPLDVTWTDQNSWSLQLPVESGTRLYTLEGVRPDGTVAGTVSVTVTSTSGIVPASAENLVVSELQYHPAAPSPAEVAAGFSSEDDFEFIEFQNIGSSAVDLTGCRFDAGISYAFASGTQIAPGARLLIPRRTAAFALRWPGIATAPEYYTPEDPTANKFSDSGEQVALLSAGGTDVKRFTYSDNSPWPAAADGDGPSLVLISPPANPDHTQPLNWRTSLQPTGSPGDAEGTAFTGDPAADLDRNGRPDLVDFAIGTGSLPVVDLSGPPGAPYFTLAMDRDLSAQVTTTVETASDPALPAPGGWQPATGVTLTGRVSLTGSMERLILHVPVPAGAARHFIRIRFTSP